MPRYRNARTPRPAFAHLVVATLVPSLTAGFAAAASYQWKLPTTGDWTTRDNWNPLGVPDDAADSAIITAIPPTLAPYTVNLTSGLSLDHLLLASDLAVPPP